MDCLSGERMAPLESAWPATASNRHLTSAEPRLRAYWKAKMSDTDQSTRSERVIEQANGELETHSQDQSGFDVPTMRALMSAPYHVRSALKIPLNCSDTWVSKILALTHTSSLPPILDNFRTKPTIPSKAFPLIFLDLTFHENPSQLDFSGYPSLDKLGVDALEFQALSTWPISNVNGVFSAFRFPWYTQHSLYWRFEVFFLTFRILKWRCWDSQFEEALKTRVNMLREQKQMSNEVHAAQGMIS